MALMLFDGATAGVGAWPFAGETDSAGFGNFVSFSKACLKSVAGSSLAAEGRVGNGSAVADSAPGAAAAGALDMVHWAVGNAGALSRAVKFSARRRSRRALKTR